jgi:2,5-furandicarboxylate decarboxylase 1
MIEDQFRLRTFVNSLLEAGEAIVIDDAVPLAAVAARLENEPRAILFRNIGDKGEELVGNVMGSRTRLALALGTTPDKALAELRRRLGAEGIVEIIDPADAPLHEVVLTGDQIDLTELPIHLQHEYDGAPYVSAAYDVSRKANPEAFNLGCRRLMLRGPRTTGVDLNAPSDLRVRYLAAVEAGEPLPVAFVIGSHPLDYLGATMQGAQENELCLLAALRGAPLPVVKCVSQDLYVPADAEIVLEGYLDAAGYVEREGPYGEYMGFYGDTKLNPLFHVTAVTHRRDALFQTVTISGKRLAHTDTAQLAAMATEVKMWDVLSRAVRQPVAVYVSAASGGISNNARASIKQVYAGEARNAVAAILGSIDVKTVMVTDDDVDIFSDDEMDWAMATRYQPDKDTIIMSGLRSTPLDPSVIDIRDGGAKLGMDLTRGVRNPATSNRWSVPRPPLIETDEAQVARSVLEVLAAGPSTFADLMRAANSTDGRDVIRDLAPDLEAGRIQLGADGLWSAPVMPGSAQ